MAKVILGCSGGNHLPNINVRFISPAWKILYFTQCLPDICEPYIGDEIAVKHTWPYVGTQLTLKKANQGLSQATNRGNRRNAP